MKSRKEIIESMNIWPYNNEYRNVFVDRFCKSWDARATLPKKLERLIAANEIWNKAKKESIVSIYTSKEEYLLFN